MRFFTFKCAVADCEGSCGLRRIYCKRHTCQCGGQKDIDSIYCYPCTCRVAGCHVKVAAEDHLYCRHHRCPCGRQKHEDLEFCVKCICPVEGCPKEKFYSRASTFGGCLENHPRADLIIAKSHCRHHSHPCSVGGEECYGVATEDVGQKTCINCVCRVRNCERPTSTKYCTEHSCPGSWCTNKKGECPNHRCRKCFMETTDHQLCSQCIEAAKHGP